MENIAWVTFLRHLPPSLHDGLAVKTLGGTEITVQTILRIDHEFFVVKGRLAATQDTGRVFFLPYNQIDHLYSLKEVREAEFNEAFDSLQMPAPGAEGFVAPPLSAEAPGEAPAAEVPEEPEPEQDTGPVPVNRPTPVPIKSAVLERFRSRTMGTSTGPSAQPSQG